MNGFEKRRERSQESILKAAAELFISHSPSAVTLSDIARKAHVSQVTIYNHFGTKENLIDQVGMELLERVWNTLSNLERAPLSALEKWERILLPESPWNNPRLYSFLHTAPDPVHGESWYRNEMEINQRTETLLRGIIAEGKANGALAPSLDEETAILLTQQIRQLYTRPDGYEMTKSRMKKMFALMLDGIIPR